MRLETTRKMRVYLKPRRDEPTWVKDYEGLPIPPRTAYINGDVWFDWQRLLWVWFVASTDGRKAFGASISKRQAVVRMNDDFEKMVEELT